MPHGPFCTTATSIRVRRGQFETHDLEGHEEDPVFAEDG